ncbi:ExbD/TolR family protein [Jannaschia pohangensis]|uniref:Biopolymer transport protein ExbD n=1 Tax=Jannaschia pohangensis TaxID=390807 RepID=A0A1I3UMI5_9RHOB|nr:biopolymer transporter ExbD [Jannaschia pohangensis]SFJ83116.1 Biopolymer transport protein ExbD [Jannaschia pohangensis]
MTLVSASVRAIELPRRRPNRMRVPLTSLADTMFQLLIFFMLASNLTPYSNLLLQGGPSDVGTPGGAGGNDPGTSAATPPGTILWTVEADGLLVGGQRFALDDIADLAATLPEGAQVVLVLRDQARVRDVATVLERLTGSGISAVRIAASGT